MIIDWKYPRLKLPRIFARQFFVEHCFLSLYDEVAWKPNRSTQKKHKKLIIFLSTIINNNITRDVYVVKFRTHTHTAVKALW